MVRTATSGGMGRSSSPVWRVAPGNRLDQAGAVAGVEGDEVLERRPRLDQRGPGAGEACGRGQHPDAAVAGDEPQHGGAEGRAARRPRSAFMAP